MSFKKILALMLVMVMACATVASAITLDMAEATDEALTETAVLSADVVAKIGNNEYETVQEAVEEAVIGTTVIELQPGTISENVVIYQVDGKNIVIKGCDGLVYTGSFHICGNNRYVADETITFDGITFDGTAKTSAHDFITSTRKEYSGATLVWGAPHNVIVKNCTFTGNYTNQSDDEYSGKEVVALRNAGGYNWTVENCTASNLHSFMQSSANYSDEGKPERDYASSINKVTVTNSKSGLNLGTNANYTVTNSTFDVVEYAVRADANSDRHVVLSFENCSMKGKEPVIIRKADSAGKTYVLNISESSIITTGTNHIIRENGAVTDTLTMNVNNNYWGGSTPVIAGIDLECTKYYANEEKTELVDTRPVSVNDVFYDTFEEAVKHINTDGTDTIIKLYTDIETTADIEFIYGEGDVIFTADKPVTIKQTALGSDYDFVVDKEMNIIIDENVTFEIYDNSSGIYLYYGPSLEVRGTVTGGQNWGSLYLFEGKHTVTETGKIAAGRVQLGYTDITVKGNVDSNYLLVEASSFTADGAVIDAGVIYDNNNGGQRWGESEFSIKNGSKVNTGKFTLSYEDSVLTIDMTSSLTAETIVGEGTIIIDTTGYVPGMASPISGDASAFAGTIELINDDEKLLYNIDENGNIVIYEKPIAKNIAVTFTPNDTESDADEGYLVYDIVIASNDGNIINRLNTADFTFAISSDKVAYEITPADDINLTLDGENRYMFNFDGKEDGVEDTDYTLTIGQVKFTGYDEFTFGVADATTNLVTATTTFDNIVDYFAPDGKLEDGSDVGTLDISGDISTEIKVPTRLLTINVAFPNAVVETNAAEQQMTVKVSGGDLAEEIVVDLGNKTFIGTTDEADVDIDDDTVTFNGAYEVVLGEELTKNVAYNVEVSGAGYRTARYTVTMTEEKTLNFWNNVKDNAVEVEEGKAASATTKNFLAGDIVGDNNINIYDLSAVVSYFATSTSADYARYVKYDLNRDGLIDSKDVAYVLVSWGE